MTIAYDWRINSLRFVGILFSEDASFFLTCLLADAIAAFLFLALAIKNLAARYAVCASSYSKLKLESFRSFSHDKLVIQKLHRAYWRTWAIRRRKDTPSMMDTRVSDRPIETDTAIRHEMRYFSTMRYYFLRQTSNVGGYDVRREFGIFLYIPTQFFFTKVAKSLESWTIFIPRSAKCIIGTWNALHFILF